MRYRITRRAAADIDAIAAFTRDRWGADQMTTYLQGLDDAFGRLCQVPELGRKRPDLQPDCRVLPYGRHLIAYRVRGETVEILAIVHQSMDLPRRLQSKDEEWH